MAHLAYKLRAYNGHSDLPALERIWGETFATTWPIEGERLGGVLSSQDQSNTGWCDVIVHDGPVGVIAYQQRRDMLAEGSIVLALVAAEHRRRKLGTALVQSALARLRRNGVVKVELGAWADPQLWHGIPRDCDGAEKFFSALGWRYYEENADLVVRLADYATPTRVSDKARQNGVRFRRAVAEDRERVIKFVLDEYRGFASYYVDEWGQNGPGGILLAETGSQIDGVIILSRFPSCPGRQWHLILGSRLCALGALMVRRDVRRRGVGLGLTAYGLEELKQEGYENCYLHWIVLTHMYEQLGAKVWRRYTLGNNILQV
jgi:predicted N-acetyltransferase YhbS